ncbi:flagellar hook-associated protein FlgK [Bacillota bacterium LX-D]|nr:flagellar hook-associated protein FlgK [Bacillota bacterium LX-D]
MSGGTFFGLNTAILGLFAQQAAVNTTAHNISNANTEGYTRQQAILETTVAFPEPALNRPGGAGQLGTGVTVAEIRRIRDAFLDVQIRKETASLGRYEEQNKTLSQVETIFTEPSDTGLTAILDKFWSAWNELSKNAENSPIRTTVRETAVTLADTLNHMSSQLDTIQSDLNQTTDIYVQEVNTIAEQIASLNLQISAIQGAGDQPNDLKDRRDYLLDKLSKITDYTYKEDAKTGMVTVTIGGKDLINGGNFNKIFFQNAEGSEQINWVPTAGAYWNKTTDKDPTNLDDLNALRGMSTGLEALAVTNGQLQGISDNRNAVRGYEDNLDKIAKALAEEINEIQTSGYDLNGENGVKFFIGDTEDGIITAANIKVNTKITSDLIEGGNIVKGITRIAAAKKLNDNGTVLAGDGSNALEIYNLSTKIFTQAENSDLAGTSITNYYKDFVAAIGVRTNTAVNNETNQQVLTNQLSSRKESYSGVSTDEEVTNLIQYQKAYQACAKVINVIDEMLETVVSGLKR